MHIPVDDPRTIGLERALGIRTQSSHQQFRVKHFPKHGNCNGHHSWDLQHPLNIAGRLVVRCRYCGAQVFKDILNHTLGKNEHRTAFKERNWLFEQRQIILRNRILDSMTRR